MITRAIHPSHKNHIATPAALAAIALTAIGCLGGPDDATAIAQQASLSQNGLAANALTANALTANALSQNALTASALSQDAVSARALADPLARELLTYVVSCALPAGKEIALTIDGVDYTFRGSLGLAASWGEPGGSCGTECRGWVSACVLSRVDYLGVHVELSVRGARRELAAPRAEQLAYPDREATYWGDIFAAPQIRRACLAPGKSQIPRVCGPSIEGCVMDVVGTCDDVCDQVRPDGAFSRCGRNRGDRGERPDVTVFLQPPGA